jgi:hypothetical protein
MVVYQSKVSQKWELVPNLSKLDDAIMAHIREIVFTEYRPFCYIDFEKFDINGKTYHVAHGTFRNRVSKLLKVGEIEREYNSKIGFYTLTGVHFGNGVTRNHMGIPSVIPVTGVIKDEMDDLLNYLKTIAVDQASVHDLHYKFSVPDIYKIMCTSSKYNRLINSVSKDLILQPDIIDNLKIQTIIHRTDTVTISVACSAVPIAINDEGILRLSVALTRTEERLSAKLDECGNNLEGGYEKIPIPDNNRWMMTLWHFGRDTKFEYKHGFCLTWGYGREVLRIYTKSLKGIKGLRNERQERPNKTNEEAFKEKIKS